MRLHPIQHVLKPFSVLLSYQVRHLQIRFSSSYCWTTAVTSLMAISDCIIYYDSTTSDAPIPLIRRSLVMWFKANFYIMCPKRSAAMNTKILLAAIAICKKYRRRCRCYLITLRYFVNIVECRRGLL